jgi:hypothetical protein
MGHWHSRAMPACDAGSLRFASQPHAVRAAKWHARHSSMPLPFQDTQGALFAFAEKRARANSTVDLDAARWFCVCDWCASTAACKLVQHV